MKASLMKPLRSLSLLLLLPGLGGLFYSAYLSTYYLETMPKMPDPASERMIPRDIHGTTIFQTEAEDNQLSTYEYASIGIFLLGLLVGVAYLKAWAGTQSTDEQNGYEVS